MGMRERKGEGLEDLEELGAEPQGGVRNALRGGRGEEGGGVRDV